MRGMSATTGQPLEGVDHLKQSIRDLLTTPLGSRVMRRDYGSRLFELVDQPVTPEWLTEAYAATAEALARWEPRLEVHAVTVSALTGGHVELELSARYLPDGQNLTLEGIVL